MSQFNFVILPLCGTGAYLKIQKKKEKREREKEKKKSESFQFIILPFRELILSSFWLSFNLIQDFFLGTMSKRHSLIE